MESKQIEEERERISKALSKRLEAHDESRKAAQEKLHKACEGLRAQIEGLEGKVASELEEKFTTEDSRLQSAYEDLQRDGAGEDISKMIQKAKAELFVIQSYDLVDHVLGKEGPIRKKMKTEGGGNEETFDLSPLCELKTGRQVVPEMVELMKPTNVQATKSTKETITFQFTCLSPDEMKVLSENGYENKIRYKCLLTKKGENEGREYALRSAGSGRFKFTPRRLAKKSAYVVRVKMIFGDKESEWSDEVAIPGGTETEGSGSSVSGLNPEKLEEELENIKKILCKRIEIHDESRKAAQEKLHEICEELRTQVDKLYEKINNELEEKFTAEDNRLQTALDDLRSSEDIQKKIQRGKAELLVEQNYDVIERDSDDNEDEQKSIISSLYELKTERKVASLEFIDFEERKSTSVTPTFTENGKLSLSFTFFSEDEVEVLKDVDSPFEAEVKMWEKDHDDDTSRTFTTKIIIGEPVCFRSTFTASTSYCLKMRIVRQVMSTQWSDETEFTTPEFKGLCVWKECPDNVDRNRKYSVDEENPRIATKLYGDGWGFYCTIIGNTPLPLNNVTSWSIKVLKSYNSGDGILIGVASSDINQNEDNTGKCGWYFYCYNSSLYSGPLHNYKNKDYGPRKEKWGQYVHTGDSVGVVMDTSKGELSFVLNGVNHGVAYEGIPLDKPLVPCVLLGNKGDSVELVI